MVTKMDDSFIELIKQINFFIKDAKAKGNEPLFFRGHGSTNWELISSLGRQKKDTTLEQRLYYDFVSYAGDLIPNHFTTWDILFLMRHHGLPTRLLDWSESFSAALYFAVKNFDKKAAIWILNPYSVNYKSIKSRVILNPNTDLTHSYFQFFIDKSVKIIGDIYALYPPKSNNRLLAQKGVFTLHVNEREPLENKYR